VDAGQRWPVQLVRALRARRIDIQDPVIVAKTGWTTDELSSGIDDVAPEGPFALVSLLIGVNDQYRGREPEDYRRKLRPLLVRTREFAGGFSEHVVVLSIPDWGMTPFAANDARDAATISTEIDAYNAVNRDEARSAGARYVDVTSISRLVAREPALIASDGLHPSGDMYTRWAAAVLPTAFTELT
jgi:lysophospholipase L1-like esterase